jgi:hypothetical protein
MTQQSSPDTVPGPDGGPVPALEGTFAMYDKPDGGLAFVARFRDVEGELRRDIPPIMARTARKKIAQFLAGMT